MISVDIAKLASAFGTAEWLEPLSNVHQRMAARVVTDFHATTHADIAIKNATAWISRAYDAGQAAGIAMERRKWQVKLGAMFDIPTVK